MLITINDASKIFKVYETDVQSKIRASEILPVNTMVRARQIKDSDDYAECKVKLFDFDEIERLLTK